MEVLAGFYIISGFVIIFFTSGFFKNYISDPIDKGTKNVKKLMKEVSSYQLLDKGVLERVPVRSHYNRNY